MKLDADALANELKALCKRLAAQNPSLELGPQLRQVCGVTERDGPRQARMKLQHTVTSFLADHPEERTTLLTALNLHPPAIRKNLRDRLQWLADDRGVTQATLWWRRRDEVIGLFAAVAVAVARASSAAGCARHSIEAFRGTMNLAGGLVRVTERRAVRALQRTDAIACSFGLPAPSQHDGEVQYEIALLSGGIRCFNVFRNGGAVHYEVQLHHPLEVDQVHEFEVAFTLPKGHPTEPHYVVQPVTPFVYCDLAVHFDPVRKPQQVWRVDGAMPGEKDARPDLGNLVPLDPSARVRLSFREIREGRAYGIAWSAN